MESSVRLSPADPVRWPHRPKVLHIVCNYGLNYIDRFAALSSRQPVTYISFCVRSVMNADTVLMNAARGGEAGWETSLHRSVITTTSLAGIICLGVLIVELDI